MQHHYHLVDSGGGGALGYRDELFSSRREAEAAARERAEWLAALSGRQVRPLTGAGRFLVAGYSARELGQLICVEECDDRECLDPAWEGGG